MDNQEEVMNVESETENAVPRKPSYDELSAQLEQLKTQYNAAVAQYTKLMELYNNLFNAYLTSAAK